MSKKTKPFFKKIECPACMETETYRFPTRYMVFWKANHYEDTRDRFLGVECRACGHHLAKSTL